MSYVGRVLKHGDKFIGGYSVVYVLSDERDERTGAQKITVLTLDDVGHRMPSDRVWWWFYDVDQGLQKEFWEIML